MGGPMRQEHDSMGAVSVPADALWGAQTQRSCNNFAIGDQRMPAELIHALARIKGCCAEINGHHGLLNPDQVQAIERAAAAIVDGCHDQQFPLSVWQTGSGTQTNMNVNEVISNLAAMEAGCDLGSHDPVHPNDHVNRSQSTNDAFPAAIHVAAVLQLQGTLLPELDRLIASLDAKAQSWMDIVKIGRTHLQDAVPLRLGDEVSAWRDQVRQGREWLDQARQDMLALPLGGTAVGSGLNTPPGFATAVAKLLAQRTETAFHPADNLFAVMAGHDSLVQAMAQLRRLAVSLLKIANDIRLLACGPRAGLGELLLPANEPGSSIMPGKVNPTQAEALTMVCAQVMGNDVAVTVGGTQGHFELNVFKPMMARNILESARLLGEACASFAERCVEGIQANRARIDQLVGDSLMLVTALNTHIGYYKAAEIAQKAHAEGTTLKTAALALGYLTEAEYDQWVVPANMTGR